ncbi:MAG: signal peptide peptidase SppA [Candidatus Promineifilaceae bacterium]|nr:signal peptide peptidase SppA [Candidatus Promineifilaceae bacterium]
MKNQENNGRFSPLVRVLRGLRRGLRALGFALQRARAGLRNWILRRRRARLDYVVMKVGGSLPERAGPSRNFIQRRLPLPPEPLSLERLNQRLHTAADAENVGGVLFLFEGFSADLSTLASFRASLKRLREAGKRAVVYTPYLDLAHYYAASAADAIVSPPLSSFQVLGLRAELLFLKDALENAGIEAEVIQISPYKTAFDPLAKADMSPEQEEQLNWLLDDLYDRLTAEMADARQMSQEQLQSLIDRAPHTADAAREHGLIDYVAYEDELAHLLANNGAQHSTSAEDKKENGERPRARLATWGQGQRLLLKRVRRSTHRYVGVLSIEGTLAMGPSRQPPIELPIPLVGGVIAGESTIIQQLRRAERDRRMAALVIHVDSSGGSPDASDLIWRAVWRVAQKKPVVAYMSNTAASGGYYICAPAHFIVAQPVTVTGSIGVVAAHVATGKLFDRLSINTASVSRGERALMRSTIRPLDETARQILWEDINYAYARFKEVVAQGRDLPLNELDPICQGRVWTAHQARQRKLVDGFGDLSAAVREAAQRADLHFDEDVTIRTVTIHNAQGFRLARPVEEAGRLLSIQALQSLAALADRPLLHLPFHISLR